ncbi:Epimerase domain-containing protein [Mycena kentingensis (nom. inval.)]|nr:Epimerase domain-containing protein [Mycena kentingensis (nom. inval.)]
MRYRYPSECSLRSDFQPVYTPRSSNAPTSEARRKRSATEPKWHNKMKVLVLGATGFIGLPISQALVRAGHEVYGLVRTDEKAKLLRKEEIIPIIGDASNPTYLSLIATLDCVISTLATSAEIARVTFDTIVATASDTRPPSAPKLNYIFSSGTWIHGDDRTTLVSDTTPITNPVSLLAGWLPELESHIIRNRSAQLNALVIRPSLVYGRAGSNFAPLFAAAKAGKVIWPGTPGGRYALVHVDDVADAYVRAAERASILGGKTIDVSNAQTESVDELLRRLVEVSGARGPYEYRKPENSFEEAVSSSAILRPYLAHALLDWHPKKASFTDGLETYYAAWEAATQAE